MPTTPNYEVLTSKNVLLCNPGPCITLWLLALLDQEGRKKISSSSDTWLCKHDLIYALKWIKMEQLRICQAKLSVDHQWVNLTHIGGATESIFCGHCEIILFMEERSP